MVKNGSKWGSSDGKIFQVINTVEIDNHTWIYYRNFNISPESECKEYSCYVESFLQRFTPLPE